MRDYPWLFVGGEWCQPSTSEVIEVVEVVEATGPGSHG
jgi:hypothetical protein